MPETLSVTMIVKNEEKFLEGCLQSIKNVADELIIVDTGSTDRTCEIARQYGAQLYNFSWINDFAAARNEALKHATCSWVLYVDADERVKPEQHRKLRWMLEDKRVDAWYLKLRCPNGTDKSAIEHLVPYPRLFRRMPGLAFVGRIHEQITPALAERKARFKDSDIVIDHLGYAQNEEIIRQKQERNLVMLSQQVTDEPKNAYVHYQLGQTLIILKRVDEGLDHLKKALEIGNLSHAIHASIYGIFAGQSLENKMYGDVEEQAALSLKYAPRQRHAHLMLMESYINQKRWNEALKEIDLIYSMITNPSKQNISDVATDAVVQPEYILYKRGSCLAELEKNDEAIHAYEQSLQARPDYFPSIAELSYRWKQAGDLSKAKEYTEKALAIRPDNAKLREMLANILIDMGEFTQAVDHLNTLLEADPENRNYLFFIARCNVELKHFDVAEELFLKIIDIAPEVPDTYRHLAGVYIRQNNYFKALDCFMALHQLLPNDEDVKRKMTALYMKVEQEKAAQQEAG